MKMEDPRIRKETGERAAAGRAGKFGDLRQNGIFFFSLQAVDRHRYIPLPEGIHAENGEVRTKVLCTEGMDLEGVFGPGETPPLTVTISWSTGGDCDNDYR